MQPLDMLVLASVMGGVSIYGIYKSRVQNHATAAEFIIGSEASAFSVALSVCSGFVSSISLLGFPAEIFYNGSMMLWFGLMYFISFPIVAYVFLPVTYNLKLTSAYQYFELRFNRSCRSVAAILFCTEIVLYNAVALYAPSMAIGTLLDIPLYISILLTALLSAIYISFGGAKAGIHTSAVQMMLIFLCMGLVVIISLLREDVGKIWENIMDGSRLRMDEFRVDPRIRHSASSLVFGGTGTILALFAANQMSLQKYMSMPSLERAQRVVLLNIPCNLFILVVYVAIGLIIFGVYHDCPPVLGSKNELLPKFVVNRLHDIPGFVGLFSVAVYSAGISTLSATFASGNAVIVEDIIGPIMQALGKPKLSEYAVTTIMRVFPAVLATLAIGLAMLCSVLDSLVLQLAFSIFGVVGGPVLGLFVLGLLVPFVRGKAAFMAVVCATFTSFSTAIVAISYKVSSNNLPINRECIANFSYAIPNELALNTVTDIDGWWGMQYFRMSYQYYSLVGVTTCLVVGIGMQLFIGKDTTKIKANLLSPIISWETDEKEQVEMTLMSEEPLSKA